MKIIIRKNALDSSMCEFYTRIGKELFLACIMHEDCLSRNLSEALNNDCDITGEHEIEVEMRLA